MLKHGRGKQYNRTTLVRTLSYSYDNAGQLQEASDPAATYDYAYDNLGRVTSETQAIAGLSPAIGYQSQYDALGNRLDLLALLDATADFHNTYVYDDLSRLISLAQAGVSGGNAIAEKRVDFAYTAAGQFQAISRYADVGGNELVANSFYGYDRIGRLTSIFHTMDSSAPTSGWGSGILAGYLYAFNAGSRITALNSYLGGSTTYSYDVTSQLTGADHRASGN
jgi:YD repeat-containing protein